jgi:hypothetical protein
MKTSTDDKCCDKTTNKTTEIRMGREVPIVKKEPTPLTDKEKKAKLAEDAASSLV